MTLVDYKGLEILDPEPTGAGGLAIQDNFVHIADALEELPLENNDAVIYVRRGEDDVESADNLRAAYAAACDLTPGGNALSATNRAVCFVPPGRYDFGTGDDDNHGLVLDTEFVDLVSLSGSPEDTVLTSVIATASRGTLEQTADDVLIRGFRIENMRDSSTGLPSDETLPSAYFPSTALANAKVVDCEFVAGSLHVRSMRILVEYSGTFTNCTSGNPLSFGGGGTASGTFTNCKGGNTAFGANGTASGTFINCTGLIASFGALVTASGTFVNCTGGENSFGGDGGAISATAVLSGCRITATSAFPTPSSGAKLLNCLDGNGQIVNWPNGTLGSFGPLDNEPPASNPATLDVRNGQTVLDFDASTDEFAIFRGIMPQRYTGHGLSVRIIFTSEATSGNAIWGAQFERCNTDSDSDSFATAQLSAATAVSGTSGISSTATIAFTNSQIDGLLAGEEFRLRVYRDADNGSDTVDSNDLELRAVEIRGAE